MVDERKDVEFQFRMSLHRIGRGGDFLQTLRDGSVDAKKRINMLLDRPIYQDSTWEDLFYLRIVPECTQPDIITLPAKKTIRQKQMCEFLITSFNKILEEELRADEKIRFFPNGKGTSQAIVLEFFQFNIHGYRKKDSYELEYNSLRQLMRRCVVNAQNRYNNSTSKRKLEQVTLPDVELAVQYVTDELREMDEMGKEELNAKMAAADNNNNTHNKDNLDDDDNLPKDGDINDVEDSDDEDEQSDTKQKKIPLAEDFFEANHLFHQRLTEKANKYKFFDYAAEQQIRPENEDYPNPTPAKVHPFIELCQGKKKKDVLGNVHFRV